MNIDDMRLFAAVAHSRSLTEAAQRLHMPKQTLSRRMSNLERSLGVRLLHRTSRRLQLTDAGAGYAERCAEIAQLAEDANRAVTDAERTPRGNLKVTADPVFGEAFVTGLVVEYAQTWQQMSVDVFLTRRHVDLIAEGFDIAFRIGAVDDAGLTAIKLGPAHVCYCASPEYLSRYGTPQKPQELAAHECIRMVSDNSPTRWPFRTSKAGSTVPVSGRLRFSTFGMVYAAALSGLGIAIVPKFACEADIAEKRLLPILQDWTIDVGGIWLVHPKNRYLASRVRTFVDMAQERLAGLQTV